MNQKPEIQEPTFEQILSALINAARHPEPRYIEALIKLKNAKRYWIGMYEEALLIHVKRLLQEINHL